MHNRIQITAVSPLVDAGRYAVKTVVDQPVHIQATLFREGHDLVCGSVAYRKVGRRVWQEVPLTAEPFDVFTGTFSVDVMGAWEYAIHGWTNHYGSWVAGQRKKVDACVPNLAVDFAQGAYILRQHLEAAKNPKRLPKIIGEIAAILDDPSLDDVSKITAAEQPELLQALVEHPWQTDLSTTPAYPLWCDRVEAGFSTWYEMFPRSVGAHGTTSGTFASASTDLPRIADMGFTVVYLPPIHPIGVTNRKGKNNNVVAQPDDCGVPWAIGNTDGGHDTINPDLGTEEDFANFVQTANDLGMEIALDFAIQCSPDHPWVTEHPEWFSHKQDGSIAFAENPPKKYEDIYPIDFGTSDYAGLRDTLTKTVMGWVKRGIKIFRVDNPHTKALPFWEHLITTVHKTNPEVLFLAEAFTRPIMMHQLGKLGFSQSYTYFTWRNTKEELTEYLVELATESQHFMRPNFWPNTPDILPEVLQHGQRSAFEIRWALAGLLSPNAGMYSGYELLEHEPKVFGQEEYMDSEKYELKPRNYNQSRSIASFITRINKIRREHVALQTLDNIWFHGIETEDAIAFSKRSADGKDVLLCVVAIYPDRVIDSWVHLQLERLGEDFTSGRTIMAHDLMTDALYHWQGAHQYIRLDPLFGPPMHVFALSVV